MFKAPREPKKKSIKGMVLPTYNKIGIPYKSKT